MDRDNERRTPPRSTLSLTDHTCLMLCILGGVRRLEVERGGFAGGGLGEVQHVFVDDIGVAVVDAVCWSKRAEEVYVL